MVILSNNHQKRFIQVPPLEKVLLIHCDLCSTIMYDRILGKSGMHTNNWCQISGHVINKKFTKTFSTYMGELLNKDLHVKQKVLLGILEKNLYFCGNHCLGEYYGII